MKLCLRLCGALGVVGLCGLGALALEETKGAATAAKADPRPFKPVAPLLVVMENVDELFPEFPKKLKDPAEHKGLKKDAQFLAELFNVVQYHKTEKDWRGWATENLEQFQKFAAACDKGDVKALQATYDAIDKTCEACHAKYRDT